MPALSAGDRINNYLLDERIGIGSFGEVWKAHHHVFGDLVAIKIPTDPQYVRHLQREGTAIHGLRDPHIVRALDMDPYCDPPYLVMEYVNGPSLRKVLQQHPNGMPASAAATVLCGVLKALEVAHGASIVHRDIKPENMLIAGGNDLSNLTPAQVKVGDFGLVRRGDTPESILQSGSLVGDVARRLAGTIAYMSPEQREGKVDVDARSDLYSLGLVLFEMLTGVLPHGRELPSMIRPETPRWLDRVFEQCYTRREQRFASAAEMLAMVERYSPAAGRPVVHEEDGLDMLRGRTACPHCHGKVQAQDQFCIHCGFQLVSRVPRCPTCHAYTGRTDNFCILCGTDLRRTA